MKKILLITYYWPPSGGAGVQRPLKFARYLSLEGYEVHVLTVDPGKASYPVKDDSFAGQIPPGVTVHHSSSFEPLNLLGLFMSRKKIPYGGFANTRENFFQKTLRFIRGNFFIPDARVGWVRPATKKAAAIIRKHEITDVLITSPPHSSQLIGIRLKKRLPQIKWIADLRDPWTDIYYYKELLHTPPAAKLDRNYERQVLERCDAAIVVSQPIRKAFSEKSSQVRAEKIHVIPNGFDETDFDPKPVKAWSGDFTLAYVGTMADSYGPATFFRVLKELSGEHPEVNFRLRLAGSISGGIFKSLREQSLEDQVEFLNYIPHNEAIREMQAADVLLLIIPDVPGAAGILTGKLFEYLGAQRPVLGIGPTDGDAAAILRETRCGSMFSREDVTGMKNYLLQQLAVRKENKPVAIDRERVQQYSRRKQAMQVASIFSNLQAR